MNGKNMARPSETSTMNRAGAACLIVAIAAICSASSLLFALNNIKGSQFAQVTNTTVNGISEYVMYALCFVAVSTFYACFYYFAFPQIPFPRFLKGKDHVVVRCLALSMLLMLGVVIWLTGGPTQSWFTSFLLVLIPLLILLQERDRLFLKGYFVAMVAIYILTAFVIPESTFKLLPNIGQRYNICCFIFVIMAVFFPVFVQLYGTNTYEDSLQPPATMT